MDGKMELICCTVDGEVRGYLPPSQSDTTMGGCGQPEEKGILEQLYQRKQVKIM